MPQLENLTYNLILELSLFHLYSLPFIFSPLENFILFFVIENTLSNFYFFSFSFDFLSNCFFGSSECQSVETYVELAEGGRVNLWKNWECYDTDEEYLTKSDWYKEMCSVEDLKNKKRNFVMRVLYRQKSQNPLPLRTVDLKQDPNIQEIPISMIPIFPKKIFQVEKKLLNWILNILGLKLSLKLHLQSTVMQ